jgi:hypothetical protein
MTDTIQAQGRCLCGAIKVAATAVSRNAGACHCGMCRKWGGGPLLTVECGRDVVFTGQEYLGVYESSAWAQRGFCKLCGGHLFYRLKQTGDYIIPVGVFDDCPEPLLDHQIFVDSKPSYYHFANETGMMTGAEVFAKYT